MEYIHTLAHIIFSYPCWSDTQKFFWIKHHKQPYNFELSSNTQQCPLALPHLIVHSNKRWDFLISYCIAQVLVLSQTNWVSIWAHSVRHTKTSSTTSVDYIILFRYVLVVLNCRSMSGANEVKASIDVEIQQLSQCGRGQSTLFIQQLS